MMMMMIMVMVMSGSVFMRTGIDDAVAIAIAVDMMGIECV
jgi:hypothetical protein